MMPDFAIKKIQEFIDCDGMQMIDIMTLITAQDALKKQVPQKPHNIRLSAFDKNCRPIYRAECPNIKCHIDVFSTVNTMYCRCCGQALDWSDHYSKENKS